MTNSAPSSASLLASAAKFASDAIEAYGEDDHSRVPLHSGTSLEHLVKACLAKRSPALLVELRPQPLNWPSLLSLLGVPEGKPKHLRTVGLRDAVERVKTFLGTVEAGRDEISLLIDLRDGVAHAGEAGKLDEEVLVAFIKFSDQCLADLGESREAYWGSNLTFVDALLSATSDKVDSRVKAQLAAASARFDRRFEGMDAGVLEAIRTLSPTLDTSEEAEHVCPACRSMGVAVGDFTVTWEAEFDRDGVQDGFYGVVTFAPISFQCPQCRLRLSNFAELTAAGIGTSWEVEDANPDDYDSYDSYDDDAAYEAWREGGI